MVTIETTERTLHGPRIDDVISDNTVAARDWIENDTSAAIDYLRSAINREENIIFITRDVAKAQIDRSIRRTISYNTSL